MKNRVIVLATALIALLMVVSTPSRADDAPSAKVKPYPLKTCLVCDMNLGEMGKPCVFVYQGQEIKVCDKSEKADFEKNPARYLKKLKAAEAELKKQSPSKP